MKLRCQRAHRLSVLMIYDELTAHEALWHKRHLSTCRNCSAEFEVLQSDLTAVPTDTFVEPDGLFWERWERGLSKKLQATLPRGIPDSKIHSRESSHNLPRLALATIGGTFLVFISIIVGRFIYKEQTADLSQDQPEPSSATSDSLSIDQVRRVNICLERSRILILSIVNEDPEPGLRHLQLAQAQRHVSRSLLDQSREIRDELEELRHQRLRRLLSQVEVVLIQIANMSDHPEGGDINVIRHGVAHGDILFKISLEQLRLDTRLYSWRAQRDSVRT